MAHPVFKYVREVSLYDERPFEHEFFLRIAQSFPFIKSMNENQDLSIIKYPYLKQLNLIDTCIDYYEQFLFDTKMDLPFGVRVLLNDELVKKVTRNFTRNRTRNNCAKIKIL